MRKDDPVLLCGKQELRFIIGAQAARIFGCETIHPVQTVGSVTMWDASLCHGESLANLSSPCNRLPI